MTQVQDQLLEFVEDYSTFLGTDIGRIDIPRGTKAILIYKPEVIKNKVECLVAIPRFINGFDLILKVGRWALQDIEGSDEDKIMLNTWRAESKNTGVTPTTKGRCLACHKTFVGVGTFCPDDGTQLILLTANDPPIGRKIDSDTNWELEIVGEISATKNALIWKAIRTRKGKVVAVKILPAKCADPETAARSIKQEARTLQKAEHPSIVKVYHFGIFEEKRPYFVMEYVDGIPLQNAIGEISLEKAKAVAVTLARALAFLHRNEIIHPALRSSEIMIVDSTIHAKIIDFGPARVSCHPNGTYSINGIISGDMSTFAPEIILLRENTKASNVYSLAAIISEMFTGKKLFGTDNSPINLSGKIITDQAPSIKELHPELNFPDYIAEILKQCLEKKQEDRPSMGELLAAFNRAWPEY